MSDAEPELATLLALLRGADPDRFLMALLAPAPVRPALAAILAFNAELARVREQVTEPLAGMIRLQFWRDALATPASAPRHPVLTPLLAAVARHALDVNLLTALIDARELDLDDQPFRTLDDLDAYAQATTAPLGLLAAQLLGGADEAAQAAIIDAQAAYALTGLLRAVPAHAAAARRFLPDDLMALHGAEQAALFRGRPDAPLALVCRDVAERAQARLDRLRAARLPRRLRPAVLAATLARLNLSVLRREAFNPFAARVQMPHPWRLLALALASWW